MTDCRNARPTRPPHDVGSPFSRSNRKQHSRGRIKRGSQAATNCNQYRSGESRRQRMSTARHALRRVASFSAQEYRARSARHLFPLVTQCVRTYLSAQKIAQATKLVSASQRQPPVSRMRKTKDLDTRKRCLMHITIPMRRTDTGRLTISPKAYSSRRVPPSDSAIEHDRPTG
jgi:hypothetical protein